MEVVVADLLVLLESFAAALVSEAGLLDAAERCGRLEGTPWLMPTRPVASWSATLKARSRFSVKT